MPVRAVFDIIMDRISYIALLCSLLFVTAYGAGCREGWTLDSNHGSCYAIPTGAQGNWAEAMGYCLAMGSELAVVESLREQDFLVFLINSTRSAYAADADFWIGAVDILEEGVFLWANRVTEVQNYFWGPGQPDNQGGRQGCLRLEHELHWAWGDGACSSTEYFICEREAEG